MKFHSFQISHPKNVFKYIFFSYLPGKKMIFEHNIENFLKIQNFFTKYKISWRFCQIGKWIFLLMI